MDVKRRLYHKLKDNKEVMISEDVKFADGDCCFRVYRKYLRKNILLRLVIFLGNFIVYAVIDLSLQACLATPLLLHINKLPS